MWLPIMQFLIKGEPQIGRPVLSDATVYFNVNECKSEGGNE